MTWRAVVGFEGRYEVSDNGLVRSARTLILLRQRPDADGYLLVTLWSPKKEDRKVHRLVLEAFVGPAPADAPQADHLNRDRADNRVENLRWASASTNLRNRASTCSSGARGVRLRRPGAPKPWQAYATHEGRFRSIGHYPTQQDAERARAAFDKEHGYV